MKEYLRFYIDGAWVDPVTPKTLDVINPANEEAFARISLGSAADVDKAVKAAQKAFEATMLACPDVYECQLISGHFDYSLRLRCRDMEHYRVLSESWMNNDALHIDKLVAHPELASIKCMAPQIGR